ncbi:MAG: RNA methyltransferase [Firmicutes bacterium]|nr:RNA methyltransferase [Bacillota bacterium]
MLITSAQNPQIKRMRSLYTRKGRERTGLIPVEGVRFFKEALCASQMGIVDVETIFVQADHDQTLDCEIEVVLREMHEKVVYCSPSVFKTLADTETPQGIAAAVTRPVMDIEISRTQKHGLYLVLDGIQDPGNMGTMIRTAAAADVLGIFCLKGTVDPYNPKSLRATAGSVFRTPIVTGLEPGELVKTLKRVGCQIIASDLSAIHYHFDIIYSGHNAIVIGSEGAGIGEQMLQAADIKVKIPLAKGVESLNAGIACGILLFEAVRFSKRLNT